MPQYLYMFGYCTPGQIEAFDKHGYDDEDSEAVFIEAQSEPDALAWGCEISREFIQRLYGGSGLTWRHTDYANWIESAPTSRFTPEQLSLLPVVRVGEHPALDHRDRFAKRVS
jgi:hypothetical protein